MLVRGKKDNACLGKWSAINEVADVACFVDRGDAIPRRLTRRSIPKLGFLGRGQKACHFVLQIFEQLPMALLLCMLTYSYTSESRVEGVSLRASHGTSAPTTEISLKRFIQHAKMSAKVKSKDDRRTRGWNF
jgi:hypothetical protein